MRGVYTMSRERQFGDVSVTFHTEEEAQRFDAYLDGEFVLYYAGEEIDRFKMRDRFEPLKFFGIENNDAN